MQSMLTGAYFSYLSIGKEIVWIPGVSSTLMLMSSRQSESLCVLLNVTYFRSFCCPV